MIRKTNRWFWIALLTPVVILLCMLYKPVMTHSFGQTIVLKTIPVDPRDLFYGDYVDLRYQIEEVKAEQLEPKLRKKMTAGYHITPVYVTLAPQGKEYVIQKVSETKPETSTYLTAILESGYGKMTLQYPMERYYVEEDTGRSLEELARDGDLLVFVKVRNGYTIITKVEKAD